MRTLATLICLLLAAISLAGGAEPVGSVALGELDAVGFIENERRELQDGELITTVDRTAFVRLDNGNVLQLSPNAAAIFRDATRGTVEVKVLAGHVTMVGKHERVRRAGAGSRFVLEPSYDDPVTAEHRLIEKSRASRSGR